MQTRQRPRNVRFVYGPASDAELTPSQKFRVTSCIPVNDQFVVSLAHRLSAYEEVCSRFGFLGKLESLKPGVHTNDFALIHRLRALKLGHASLATVFRPGRLPLQPILRENLDSPVLRYQPITTAVVTDACLNTRWHHGAYTSAVLRESLGLDRVVTVYVA